MRPITICHRVSCFLMKSAQNWVKSYVVGAFHIIFKNKRCFFRFKSFLFR